MKGLLRNLVVHAGRSTVTTRFRLAQILGFAALLGLEEALV